jgi:hypothetical protein
MNEKERACIAQSHEAHLVSARRRLADFGLGMGFENPLMGFTGSITWEESRRDRMKQIAVLPLAFLVALFLAAMTPILYIAHRLDLFQRRRAIVKEIRALEKEGPSMDVPDKKEFEHLWAFHGFHGSEYNSDEQVDLLNKWVITLYGNEIADSHRVKEKFKEIAKSQLEAGSTHIHFASPFSGLLSSLSEKLPDYA